MPIPKRQVIDQSRKQPGLKHAQQEPHSRDSRKVVRPAQRHGHGTPTEHEKRQPATRPKLFERNVGRHFKDGVRDKEDHERNHKLVVGHACAVLHVIACRAIEDLGVANVGAV